MTSVLPHFDAPAVAELVPFADAVSALRSAFASPLQHMDRLQTSVADGDFLVMGAALEAGEGEGNGHAVAGTKMVMVQPRNVGTSRPLIAGSYCLFDADRGCPIATMDGAALTNLRTPAASIVAALALSVEAPKTAVIVGRGTQGRAHERAFTEFFPSLERVVFVARGERIPSADHVVGATSAVEPFLSADMVKPGTHITLVGSYRPDMREVCADVVSASDIFIDEGRAARAEAGDLIQAEREGWSWDRLVGDLSDLASGRALRSSGEQITLVKSVGLAVQDLIVARLVAHRADLFER